MRTISDAENWHFTFSITDLALLLGKSPVTLRSWERKGFVTMPRDSRGDRRFRSQDVRKIASKARDNRRINNNRYEIVIATMMLLDMVEKENREKK